MWFIIIWLIVGCYGLVENADAIAEVESKGLKLAGMAIITITTPFYLIVEIFDYVIAQIFTIDS